MTRVLPLTLLALASLAAVLAVAEMQLAAAATQLRVGEAAAYVAWVRGLAWLRADDDLVARAESPTVARPT